jgi:hypothetical protein
MSGESDAMYDGATCPSCKQVVPTTEDKLDQHLICDGRTTVGPRGVSDASMSPEMCPGGGSARMDHIEHRGGKWVLLAESTDKVLGTHATKAEAEAQERAVQASKHNDSRVRRFERIDFSAGELPRKQVTQDGFWRVAGKVARTGIQEYRDSSGGVRRELRLPEEVRASLPSFALQPLTNNHPPQMVTPDNAKRFVAGAVGEATMDGDWVAAPLTIYDAAAIAAVEGGRAQLSVGYSCRLEDMSGTWQGQHYDGVQRDIVVNHVAIVDLARAGSEARIRLDAGDAIAGAISDSHNHVLVSQLADTATTETMTMPIKMKLDGFEIEVQSANDQAVIQRALDAARKQGEEHATTKAQADVEKLKADSLKERDALQGKFDTLDAKVKADAAATIKLDGAEITMADFADEAKREAFLAGAIAKAATARTALVIEARKHLGDKEKLDGKSDFEVKKMVVLKLNKTAKLDGKSEDYVQACYDTAIEGAASNRVSPIDAARAGATAPTLVTVQNDAAPNSAEDARQASWKRAMAANPKNNVR